jgi:hypothetical protein
MAEEFKDQGVAVNCLWPRTAIATAAVNNMLGGGDTIRLSRTAGGLTPCCAFPAASWANRSRSLVILSTASWSRQLKLPPPFARALRGGGDHG